MIRYVLITTKFETTPYLRPVLNNQCDLTFDPGGGGGSLAHKLATHPRPSTSKMNPKWRIAPCYICTRNGVTLAKHKHKWRIKIENDTLKCNFE